MILPASYHEGFAPRDGRPLYPELWCGCVGAWAPCLGPSGSTVRDWSPYKNNCDITLAALETFWGPKGGRVAITTDGANDLVQSVVPQISGLTVLTLSGWVWRSSGNWCFGFGGTSSAARLNLLMFSNIIYASVPGSATNYASVESTHVGLNHYAMQYIAGAAAKIWINGIQQNVANNGNGGSSITGAGITTFWAGREIANGYQPGSYLDMTVHNRLLADAEIKCLSRRPGIAYEIAPRRRSSVQVVAGFNRRRRLLIGASN